MAARSIIFTALDSRLARKALSESGIVFQCGWHRLFWRRFTLSGTPDEVSDAIDAVAEEIQQERLWIQTY